MAKCQKCNGRGTIGHYSHVEAGICFACNGTGEVARVKKSAVKIPEISDDVKATAEKVVALIAEGKVVYGAGFSYSRGISSDCFNINVYTNELNRVEDTSKGHGTMFLGLCLDIQNRHFSL